MLQHTWLSICWKKFKIDKCAECYGQLMQIDKCAEYYGQLMQSSVPDSDIYYTFLEQKMYREGALIVSSQKCVDFVESLEVIFKTVFPEVVYQNGLLYRLYKNAVSCEILLCKGPCEGRIHVMLVLYLKTQIHYELKNATINKSDVKRHRNHKVLKLMHL